MWQRFLLTRRPGDCCVCNIYGFIALKTAMVLCARSQDPLLPVSVCRVLVLFSTAGFKGGEKPCSKTRETAALQRGILKASHT